MTMSEALDKGIGIFGEIYGEDMARRVRGHIESSKEFGSEQARWAMEFAFGTVWAREGLARKMRSCTVLGMVIALRQTEEIKYHTKMGLANGLTRQELEEIMNTTVPYCGLPASNVAKAAMLEAFAEIDAKAGK
jgi:alkylhydroperoxidase/carboxymuconolactone decarboxylase family protein YurZ